MLRYSVLASLLSEYIPDGVGISPTTVYVSKHSVGELQALGDQQKLSSVLDNGSPQGTKLVQNGESKGLFSVEVRCV